MAETRQFPDHLMSSLPREGDSDDCNSLDEADETTEPDIDGKEVQQEEVQTTRQFPPQDDMADEMAKYLFKWKKIPVKLPVHLTSGASSFPKRLVPVETHCNRCPDQPQLSEPFAVTKRGKLITTTHPGLVTGIEICVKFCPHCQLPYWYQEHSEGMHNFNDFWVFSLGFMDLVRQFFKVHTAFSRACEAVTKWLGLGELAAPTAVVRNAYLHFEALCDHKYDYFCVLCGHHPPFLVTDADKKGMFDLSASDLEIPQDGSDEVDADAFWDQVCLAMIFRGFLHSGLSDAHNRFVVKPSYKFWAPWVGTHSRRSHLLLNTEYMKCHHIKDVAQCGTRRQMNLEDVLEILEQGSVSQKTFFC